jgi:hypothetical protein
LFWEGATCLNFTPEELCSDGAQVPSMPQHLLHSPHRSDVLSAASLGCHFCSIIIGSVAGCTGDHGGRQFSDDDGPIYISMAVLNQDDGTFLLSMFACDESSILSHDQVLNSFPLQLRPIRGMSRIPKTFKSN